ncbi:type VI secretion system Vgr family protein [Rahnella victoriana]|uniref:type VI secretion system Vgr family protein n=1 Tax=Rahnella victoriana TaxID=1510570 RepID=UPI001E4D66DE|nr:type VI secretion system Vgr family protein [Rahnella victoriana]UHM93429.1 type VI secretion system tip protein VgrG [Rahnella victoriana]
MSKSASPFFDHSHHKLAIRGSSAQPDVLSFTSLETLSKPFHYDIEFTSADRAIDPKTLLMQDASLTLQAPVMEAFGVSVQQPQRVIQGVITAFKRLSTSKDESHYEVRLQPRLALLDRSHQNSIYQDMSVPQIVEKILRERHDMRGQDFVFTLSKEYLRREQVMQYGEDDLTFISRLLAEVGIWFRFTADPKLNIDVVEFYDDQQHYQPGLTLAAVPPSGMHDVGVESAWDLASHYQVVEKNVSTRDYNYRTATTDLTGNADVTRGDTTTYGEAYHYADNYLTAGGAGRDPEPESGAFYARLRHERYLNNQARFSGKFNAATLVPGQELKTTGDAPAQFAQGVVIVSIESSAKRDKSFEVTFEAIAYSEDYCFRAEPADKPVMAGTLPARVTSTTASDTYGHIDKDGRYRVNMLFDRDAWEQGYESLWVRQARPYAGDTYGMHMPLLAGTEVAIAFEDGNPDRPYIAHVLHDSAHGDHVTIQNYKRNVLRTPSNNKLRLDDERGKEHIKLSTEYGGKSQLNLGHLVDSGKQQRGEGFELRTDSFGAIRAQKGIFISADGQLKAQGKVLEMVQPISLMKGALNRVTEWGNIAQTHHNFPPENNSLNQLLVNATELKGPVLLMSAPQGISAVTPESMLLQTGKAMYLQGQGEINLTSSGRFSANAAQAVSLLSQQEGMRLVSGKGPLEVESHGDILSMTALKDVTVQSTQGHLQLTAKNGITIGCGGAYIRLTPQGEIEIHGPGLLSLKGMHKMESPASQDFPLPELPNSVCKECLKMAQSLAQGFVPRGA